MGVLAPASGVPEFQAAPPRGNQSAFLNRMAFRFGIAAVLAVTQPSSAESADAPEAGVEQAADAPAGFKEYIVSKHGDVKAKVETLVWGIENVRTFDEREALVEELRTLQNDTYFLESFGGFRAETYMLAHIKDLTPEQRMRLRSLANRFDPHEVPFVVPRISAPFDSFCEQLSECVHHELRLEISDETRARLQGKTISIPEGGERMWDVVKRLSEAGDLKVVLSSNGIALTDNDVPELRMLATDGKAALFLHPAKDGKPQHISVAFEPGSGGHFLHAEEAVLHTGPVNRFVVAPPHGLQQLIDVHKKTYAMAPDTRTDAWHKGLNWHDPVTRVSVTPTRTYLPVRQRMELEELNSTQCGMQQVIVNSIEKKDGVATVTVTVNSWLDKNWCSTPYIEDRSRYLWGAGAALRFLDENGKEIAATEGIPSMNQEKLTRTFTMPEGATSVEIVTHATIGKDKPFHFSFPSEHIQEEFIGQHGMPPVFKEMMKHAPNAQAVDDDD